MSTMRCWICSDDAMTGEHLIKASDLRSVFGHVSQKSPVYFHTALRRNQPIGGIKSDVLKSNALICARCNNQRTQPYDLAWERLSTFIRDRKPPIRSGDWISLQKIFTGPTQESMLRVHLFFVKLFGCAIIEHNVPIDIAPFSRAILHETPHPYVYVAITPYVNRAGTRSVGYSDMDTAQLNGQVAFAVWMYVLNGFSLRIMYAAPSERHRNGLVRAWHPSTVRKCIRVANF
jgi:hypothetical protein